MKRFNCFIEKFDSEIRMKISSNEMELNLVMTENESIDLIKNIHKADWNERQSIKAGVCLKSNVFWCLNEDRKSISLLIGHDDETWDIGIMMSLEIIDKIKIETGYNNGYK